MKKISFNVILVFIVLAVWEILGYIAINYTEGGENIRKVRLGLMAKAKPEDFPRYLPQPNLNYISYPGVVRNGVVQNNEDGYRGCRINYLRSRNFRILFLGGSTTYGIGVPYPWQSYPERIKSLLNEYFSGDTFFHSRYDSVEIINAGIEDGTSCEELSQYLYKYRYYKPDICVVNSGVNDASFDPNDHNYQPDYTHVRNIDFNIRPLGRVGRCLMRSNFLSFLIVKIFYNHLLQDSDGYLAFSKDNKYVHWFKQTDKNHLVNAFYYNYQTLLRELIADSVEVIFVPCAWNPAPRPGVDLNYFLNIAANNKIGRDLTLEYKQAYVNFNYDSFACKQCFLDECHLNVEGEIEKAKLIAPTVAEIIKVKLKAD
jgi:lysophospholipase L1-like esterase